jgi:thiol-disulfide isomerase/thioredoxin
MSATGTFDVTHAAQEDFQKNTHETLQQSGPLNLTGKVTDIITASGITYVEIDTVKEKVWAAGTVDKSLGIGDKVSFSTAMPMQNFHSKSLDRNFAVIYFVKQFITGDQVTKKVTPTGQSGKPESSHPVTLPSSKTPGEVVTGSFLRDASLDGLNTNNKVLAEYKGKPLLINVWASWCGPCRAEMGSLERLAKRYNGKMLNIIGISTDDYRHKATTFIDQEEVSFENFIDHELLMENMLGATTIPLTVLVDADGRVLQKVRGSREWDSPEILEAIGNVFQIKLM